MIDLKNILKNALNNAFKNKDENKADRAIDRMDKGKDIHLTDVRSDRFTYDNTGDRNYDKDWKPTTPEEKETLSPEGYFRTGKENDEKAREEKGINKDNEEFYQKRQISIPSTALSDISYDPDTEALEVKFVGNPKKYFYPAVPLELVQALLKATSKGEFFMENIHDQYTMNPGHKPQGEKGKSFYSKYVKKYKKNNKGKWSK